MFLLSNYIVFIISTWWFCQMFHVLVHFLAILAIQAVDCFFADVARDMAFLLSHKLSD